MNWGKEMDGKKAKWQLNMTIPKGKTCEIHTFFGGRIAIADLGVIDRWWWWWGLGSFSPLRERRMA